MADRPAAVHEFVEACVDAGRCPVCVESPWRDAPQRNRLHALREAESLSVRQLAFFAGVARRWSQ